MHLRNIKQVDILNSVLPVCQKYGLKMNRSDISQYVSGKVKPNQDKLYALSEALNVDPAWLMGADVPMNHSNNADIYIQVTANELDLIEAFRLADPIFQKEALEMLRRHSRK